MVNESLWKMASIQFFVHLYWGENISGILEQNISRWAPYFVSEAAQQKRSQAVTSESFLLGSCFYQLMPPTHNPQSCVHILPILHSLVQIPSPSREALSSPQLELIPLPSQSALSIIAPKYSLVLSHLYRSSSSSSLGCGPQKGVSLTSFCGSPSCAGQGFSYNTRSTHAC